MFEHQVPVCTLLPARLCKYEPVIKLVENAHTPFFQGDKGRLHDFGEDARRQEQPEGQNLVLICQTSNANRRNGLCRGRIETRKYASFRSIAANQSRGQMPQKMRFCVNILNGSL